MNWMNSGEDDFTKFRSKGIGSSDAPIIMGVSPWKKPFGLWQEKTGIKKNDFKGNFATRRGVELEPMVRKWYNETYEVNTVPERAIHPEHEFLRANCDGIDREKGKLIEIKCGNLEDHINCVDNARVPDKYYPQLQFLMIIFGYEKIDYVSYHEKDEKSFCVVPIRKNEEYCQSLLEKCHEFWDMVKTKTPPPLDESEDFETKDEVLSDLIARYDEAKIKEQDLKNELKILSSEIEGLLTHKKTLCNNYRITLAERKGSVNYKKLLKEKNILFNEDDYRGASSHFVTIRKVKK